MGLIPLQGFQSASQTVSLPDCSENKDMLMRTKSSCKSTSRCPCSCQTARLEKRSQHNFRRAAHTLKIPWRLHSFTGRNLRL